MGVTSYYSFGGEILGEETGGVRRDYLTDALGSVTATVTSAGAVENTYRYKPYGEQLAKTGTGNDPKFLWSGKWGYLSSNKHHYVRNRHYLQFIGFWTSVDKYFPKEKPYAYCENNPICLIDYDGYQGLPPACSSKMKSVCPEITYLGCALLCKHQFKTENVDCYQVTENGTRCATCCRCNPCERYQDTGDPGKAAAVCLRRGEKLPGNATSVSADKCDGIHKRYKMKDGTTLSVWCCKCTNAEGKVKTRCDCKRHNSY